jgi:hypothetical protein
MKKLLMAVLLAACLPMMAVAGPVVNVVPPCDDRGSTDQPPCDADAGSVTVPPPLPNEDESVITPPEMPGDGLPGPAEKRDPGLPAPVEPSLP